MNNKNKRKNKTNKHSITYRMRRALILSSVLVLILCGGLSLLSLFVVRSRVTDDSIDLGVDAFESMYDALTEQMEQNQQDLVNSGADYANSQLNIISCYVREMKYYIEHLYRNADQYPRKTVNPPDAANGDTLTFMRNLADTSVQIEDVQDEMGLLANAETIFRTVINASDKRIAAIYLATDSGFMLNLDTNSVKADQGTPESYFDFRQTEWFKAAKAGTKVVFTEPYHDGFGKGLIISCAAPFRGKDGQICGVISMDYRLQDLLSTLTSKSSVQSVTVLVSAGGDLIASPTLTGQEDTLPNILRDNTLPIHEVAGQLLGGSTIARTDENLFVAAKIPLTGWLLVHRIPMQGITNQAGELSTSVLSYTTRTIDAIYRLIWIVFVILIFIFLVVLAIITFAAGKLSSRLIKPLLILKKDVMQIGNGDLNHRAEVIGNDEIADLAREYNKMSASLNTYIDNLTRVTAERERIGAELNVATQIQADMLPRIFPPFPNRTDLEIYATMHPAKEVGGDFYDFFLIDQNHLCLVMADVSGKGVPAALFMVIAKTLLKSQAQLGIFSPAKILSAVNEQLIVGNDAELFVTVWLAIIDLSTGEGISSNAGHEHPAIRHRDGDFALEIYRHSPALATMEGIRFRERSFKLEPGDVLFVYTDGVPEATNSREEFFGSERMLEALNREASSSPEALIGSVRRALDDFVQDAPQFDDVTMLAFAYKCEETEAPSSRSR